jgi:hypothetical protein
MNVTCEKKAQSQTNVNYTRRIQTKLQLYLINKSNRLLHTVTKALTLTFGFLLEALVFKQQYK